jgi:hypothetical protein
VFLKIVFLFLAICCAVFGVILGKGIIKRIPSFFYASVKGIVTNTILDDEVLTTDCHNRYFLDVVYKYEVRNTLFEGCFSGKEYSSETERLEAKIRYESSDINVFYDPKKPSKSTLERGLNQRDVEGFIIVWFAFSVFLFQFLK